MATVTPTEVDALPGQLVQVGSANIRLTVGLPLGLTVRSDRTPAQIINVQVENVRPGRFVGDNFDDDRSSQQ